MIPKQLFFIWIGNKPKYVDFCVNSFKQMNPKFTVDLINYQVNDIVNTQDSVINLCKKYIELTKKGIENKYYFFIKHRIESKFNYIQILCDILRFELIYYYGGIYIDCDTFPQKPFDMNLLARNCFAQSILTLKPKNIESKTLHEDYTENYDYKFINNLTNYLLYMYVDIYFIGSKKEYTDNEFYFDIDLKCSNPLTPPWIRNFDNDNVFKQYKKDFYNLKSVVYKTHIFYTQYILHFCNRCWQKSIKKSPMYCELDDYLYGDKL